MIPYLQVGLRVICPDLVGYGKSDKPAAREDYTYERQVEWMGAWLEQNDFSGVILWSGLGWAHWTSTRCRTLDRFDNVVIGNTGLPYNPDVPQAMVDEVEDYRANAPTPTLFSMTKELRSLSWDGKAPNPARIFAVWQKFCWETVHPPFGLMLSMMTEKQSTFMKVARALLHKLGVRKPLPSSVAKAYDAPFSSAEYVMGPRAMPSQVPSLPTSPSLEQQRLAWEFFDKFESPSSARLPTMTLLPRVVPSSYSGCQVQGQPHTTIRGAGHFLQETRPKEVSRVIIDVIARSAA